VSRHGKLSDRVTRIAGVIALLASVALACPVPAAAANVCGLDNDTGSGLGGTGRTQNSGGIGGTGKQARAPGLGGTGKTAGEGLGGTGKLAVGSGLGGTGKLGANSGLGGTGKQAVVEGGIGGTGKQAAGEGGIGGTGVVGTITGFASICVNGIEIHYSAGTPVDSDGKATSVEDLRIGQVVAVEASGHGGEIQARHITVLHEVAGRIDAVDRSAARISVLGQEIVLAPGARLAGTVSDRALNVGDHAQVSGLRRADGVIVASRIDGVSRIDGPGLKGPVTRVEGGYVVVHGTRIDISRVPGAERITAGKEIQARGDWDGGTLHAREVAVQPSVPFADRVEQLELQGYIQRDTENGALRLSGLNVEVSAATRIEGGDRADLGDDRHVLISGRVGDGDRVHADLIQFRREMVELPEVEVRPNTESGEDDEAGHEQAEEDREQGESEQEIEGAEAEHETPEVEEQETGEIEVEEPEVEEPEVETPEVEVPEVEVPEVETPEVEVPEVETPEVEVPEVEVPEVEVPEVEVPEVEVPEVEVPEVEVPEVEVPEVEVPEFEAPEVEEPEPPEVD